MLIDAAAIRAGRRAPAALAGDSGDNGEAGRRASPSRSRISVSRRASDETTRKRRNTISGRWRCGGSRSVPDHPDIALNLNNLATLYRATGNLPRSLETHFQALSILEKNTGPYNIVNALGNIARTYAAMDDVPHAIEFQRRVDAAIETDLALQLAIGSERQKLAFVNSLADRIERTISLDVGTRFSEPQATELAALVVLQRKGRILDAMTDTFASVRRRLGSPEEQRAARRPGGDDQGTGARGVEQSEGRLGDRAPGRDPAARASARGARVGAERTQRRVPRAGGAR